MLDSRAARVGACACVVAATVAALSGCSGSPASSASSAGGSAAPNSTSAATASASPSAASTARPSVAAPSTVTASPSVAVATAPPARIGTAAPLVGKLLVTVGSVRAARISASGPGEIAGPGLVVPVTVRNATGKLFDLSGLVVNALYGDGTPAVPSDAAPARPLPDSVAAGSTATGLYVFRAGTGATTTLSVEVSSDNARRVLVFRG